MKVVDLVISVNSIKLKMLDQMSGSKLDQILEPEAIPFSFDTIGWKTVFALLILIAFLFIFKTLKKYRDNKYKRLALSSLDTLFTEHSEHPVIVINKFMFIIKQTALQSYERKEVAKLQGKEWIEFLNNSNKKTSFSNYEQLIMDAIYQNQYKKDNKELYVSFLESSKNWIRYHA